MSGTIPFALGWAGVLAAVAGVVRLRERGMKKQVVTEVKPAEAKPIEPPSETVAAAPETRRKSRPNNGIDNFDSTP